MNLIMKKVTSWAAIIAVPTAITGFYGQNLPYPGFGKESGLIFSSALIIALSTLLYACSSGRTGYDTSRVATSNRNFGLAATTCGTRDRLIGIGHAGFGTRLRNATPQAGLEVPLG